MSVKILIALLVVLVVFLGTLISMLIIKQRNVNKLKETLIKAETYLEQMDYANAIDSYKRILELDNSNEEVYAILAVLYEKQGDISSAMAILIEGYQVTSSQRLSDMMYSMNLYGYTGYDFLPNESLLVTLEYTKMEYDLMVNNDVFDTVLNYNFDAFVSHYGECSFVSEGNYSIAEFNNIRVLYPETITNKDSANTYDGPIQGVQYHSVSAIFGISGDSITYEMFTDYLGVAPEILYNSSINEYTVAFTENGCKIEVATDQNGNVLGDNAWNQVSAIEVFVENNGASEESIDTGSSESEERNPFLGWMTGKVVDAVTGKGVKEVKIEVRKGFDIKSGNTIYEGYTDYYGNYTLELDEGNYCIALTKDKYTTEYENISIIRGLTRTSQNFVMSGELEAGEVRIVLEWNAEPRDLDSILKTPYGTVSFMNMSIQRNGQTYASLDLDDTNGYGPETITITNGMTDSFTYCVYDFTNGTGEGSSISLSDSGATVKLYLAGQSQPQIFYVPSGSGYMWEVFSLDNGIVTTINRITNSTF